MTTFNTALYQLSGQDIYVYCDPDVLDFTSKRNAKLVICCKDFKVEVPLDVSEQKLKETLGYLEAFIGGENSIVITWNWKNFLSFAKGKTGKDFKQSGKLFELSLLESYCGVQQERPKNFAEAKNRLGHLVAKKQWERIYSVYQGVYIPLIHTLPQLETCGVLNVNKKAKVYAHYEIDGTANGRLKASQALQFSYNPHILGPDEREYLKAPGWGNEFMIFDYKHMEVSVVQWLTQDSYMKEILDSGRDFYEAIWDALFPTIPCNEQHRKTCKEFFLPTVYGLGIEALSQKISWPLEHARNLYERLHKLFPTVFNWIKTQQSNLINGYASDYYGRIRHFDTPYKVRNFVIQAPAALICLHKLTQLAEAVTTAQVCMHIHDGYVLLVKKESILKTFETARQTLESEHELYPGLKLKTVCSIGPKLSELKNVG